MASKWKQLSPKGLDRSKVVSPISGLPEIAEVRKLLENERLEKYRLQAELERKSSEYRAKEASYLQLIGEYESILSTSSDLALLSPGEASEKQLSRIRGIHGKVMEQVRSLREKAGRWMAEQEGEIVRKFDGRIRDLQRTFNTERRRHQEALLSSQLAATSQTQELLSLQSLNSSLETHNRELESTVKSLRSELQYQRYEHQELLKRLYAAKKQQLTHLRLDEDKPRISNISLTLEDTAGENRGSRTDRTEDSVVRLLTRTLEKLKKELRSVKVELMEELGRRSEVEMVLRKCLEDLRDVIAKEERLGRAQFLETLLEREKIVAFLKDHLFPIGKSKEIARKMAIFT